jgi:PGF-CTERM protein
VNTTGQDSSAGDGIDLTTAQMTGANAANTMDGFAFPANNSDGTWHVTNSYPAFSWQDTTAFYSVTIEETTSPVDEGDTLSVTTNVMNLAANGSTQTIRLNDTGFSNVQQDSNNTTLATGEFSQMILEWSTTDGDTGTGLLSVYSDNETVSQEVTIRKVSAPSGGSGGSGGGSSSGSDDESDDGTVEDDEPEEVTDDPTDESDDGPDDIEPAVTAEDSEPETDAETPGFGALVALVALIGAAMLAVRRQN